MINLNGIDKKRPHLNRVVPNLRYIKKSLLTQNMDYFIGISGYERSGKSNLAQAIAQAYLILPPKKHKTHSDDLTLSKEHFIFSPEDFFNVPYNVPRGSPIIIDEGGTAMLANDAVTRDGIEVKKTVTVMGERNLFVIICAPQWDLLQPYIRARRLQTLFKVVRRGAFVAYNRPAILKIRKDPKTNQLIYPPPVFVDAWQERKGQLWDDYEEMKSEYLKNRNQRAGEQLIGITEACKVLGLAPATVYRYCESGDIPYIELFNGQIKFRPSDLNILIKEHYRKPTKKGMNV